MASLTVVAAASPAGLSEATCGPALTQANEPAGPAVGEKSENLAIALSLAGALAGPALALAADNAEGTAKRVTWPIAASLMLVGPSLGQWYAHDMSLVPIGVRAAGFGLMYWGLVESIGASCDDCHPGQGLALLGVGAVVGATAYEVITAPRAVRRFNARPRGITALAPMLNTTGNQIEAGLMVAGRF